MIWRTLTAVGLLAAVFTPGRAQIDCSGPEPGSRTLLAFGKVIFSGKAAEREASGKIRFEVMEVFKGAPGKFVDLDEFPGPLHFELGQEYLIFGVPCMWWDPSAQTDKTCLTSQPCSDTRLLEFSQALVEQLRAEKIGKQVASLYGTLYSTETDKWQAMPHVAVRLLHGKQLFVSKTDEHGVYAFDQLPKGTYQISADLPRYLELTEVLGEPSEPLELPSRSSLEHDLYAYPTGSITGRVIGPDGQPLQATCVHLYPSNKKGDHNKYGCQGPQPPSNQWKPFVIDHLAPGDYVLVFNYADRASEEFHRTYYGGVPKREESQVIHLARGEHIQNADIHVVDGPPRQWVTVHVAWNGRKATEYYPVQVTAEGGWDAVTWPEPRPGNSNPTPDTYTLNLWRDVKYSIRAVADCLSDRNKQAKSSVAVVGPGDASVSDITLTFDQGGCSNP